MALWTCPDCKRTFGKTNQGHTCAPAMTEKEYFATGPDFERPIFDEVKAKDFYVDFLGFEVDWEHRFGDNFPLYMQVSRAGMGLHLSGHHGDATPGSNIFATMHGVHAYQQELAAKDYRFMKPGVEELPWGDVMEVTDPFGNRIRFCEQKSEE